jgi:GT2 family glycosyltransferase
MSRVHIVIVNYRTPTLVVECLRSLADEVRGLPNSRVVVVENDSRDGSAEVIQNAIQSEGWGSWVELMPLDRNRGFAGGNNAAIRPLLGGAEPPDYFVLLNPDTYVRPGAVRTLVAFMDRHPAVGIAGSRLENPDGSARRCAFRFHSLFSELESGLRLGLVSKLLGRWRTAPPVRDEEHACDWVSGACMIARRAVFEDIGLMDEGYFLYYEETDFCLRARLAGWACWHVPGSRVVHLVGQSTGVTSAKQTLQRRPRYWFESRRRYFTRNHGRLYAFAADLAWTAGFACWRLRRLLQRKPDPDPPSLLWDFVRFTFWPG